MENKQINIVTPRMDWDSYAYLKSLVEKEKLKLESDFRMACCFIPPEQFKRGRRTGIEKAHKIFLEEDSKLNKVLDDLRLAVAPQQRPPE